MYQQPQQHISTIFPKTHHERTRNKTLGFREHYNDGYLNEDQVSEYAKRGMVEGDVWRDYWYNLFSKKQS